MSELTQINPLAHLSHDVTDIPDAGLKVDWHASKEELAGLTAALEVTGIERITVHYDIKRTARARQGGLRYRLTGELSARLTQACVVTLEPIAQRIQEKLDEEFRPQDDIEPRAAEESEVLSVTDPEPFVDGKLEVGRLIFEYLSSAIDPFPRREGESLEWQDSQDAAQLAAENPFAVLAKLKDKN